MYCEHCLNPITKPLPVEPLYDLDVAAFLIPCKIGTLQGHLKKRRDEYPYRYRVVADDPRRPTIKRRVRLLSAGEIIRLRAHFVRAGQKSKG